MASFSRRVNIEYSCELYPIRGGKVRPFWVVEVLEESEVARNLNYIDRIHATVMTIPTGRVATYGQVAKEAGLPRRARMVGTALRHLTEDSGVPWHRVVNAGGRISERPRPDAVIEQRILLEDEGVVFTPSGRIDLKKFGWRP